MARRSAVGRAFNERELEVAPEVIDDISRAVRGRVRGVGRTGPTGETGYLVVSTAGAVVWDAASKTTTAIDFGEYATARTKGSVVTLEGDGVDPLTVFAGDQVDAWLAFLAHHGITPDSDASPNAMRTRVRELEPAVAPHNASGLAVALARELAAGETVDVLIPARRVGSGTRAQGVIAATPTRIVHVEEHPRRRHVETFTFEEAISVSSGVSAVGNAVVTVAHADALRQYVVGPGKRGRAHAESLVEVANDRVPVANRDRARWWERSTLPRVSVSVLEYYGGHPVFPKGAGTLLLKLSNSGLTAESQFGTLFTLPWSSVTAFSVEAADSFPRRIPTPTRLLAVGPAAFMSKHSAYEQSHLVVETADGEMVFAISQTPQKVRSRVGPYVGAFAGQPHRAIGVTYHVGDGGADAPPSDDPIETIRRLAELRDAGALTTAEFTRKKAELLKRV